jgi:uncharacterized protein
MRCVTRINCEQLSRGESLDMLALGNLGQLLFTRNARQSAVPARYVVEDNRVLVHVMAATNTVWWRDGDVLTLHVSTFDADQRRGWSVSVTGRAHGTPHLGCAAQAPSAPWIPRGGGDLLEIASDVVEGERLGAVQEPAQRDASDDTP